MILRLTRRRWAQACLAAFSPTFSALAARRGPYGGTARLVLPLCTSSMDPHDPEDLTSSLIGGAVFEPLYGRSTQGIIYPTLAARLPERVGNRLHVTLRPGMCFSSGRPISAKDVVYSLRRSQRLSHELAELGTPSFSSATPQVVTLTTQKTERVAAELLSSLAGAIVPEGFSPLAPEGCGAFRATPGRNALALDHNPLAPRGGSFLDRVLLVRSSVGESLRAFEATQSAFSLLGAGLHQARSNATRVQLQSLGYAVLVPGPRWDGVRYPGELHTHLAYLPDAPFAALGLKRARHSPAKWGKAPFSVLVDQGHPLLLEVAKELKEAWARRPSDIIVTAASRDVIDRRVAEGSFDTRLTFMAHGQTSDEVISRNLFALDKKSSPRAGRVPPPDEAARQLHLGLVGEFEPLGAVGGETADIVSLGRLRLEQGKWLG